MTQLVTIELVIGRPPIEVILSAVTLTPSPAPIKSDVGRVQMINVTNILT